MGRANSLSNEFLKINRLLHNAKPEGSLQTDIRTTGNLGYSSAKSQKLLFWPFEMQHRHYTEPGEPEQKMKIKTEDCYSTVLWVLVASPETRHIRSLFPSVSVNPVEFQWCSLWAELALNYRLDKIKPVWRSPSNHSCRFHSFPPNTRHKWERLCGCLSVGLCVTEIVTYGTVCFHSF